MAERRIVCNTSPLITESVYIISFLLDYLRRILSYCLYLFQGDAQYRTSVGSSALLLQTHIKDGLSLRLPITPYYQ